jgi:hypothetical protein
MENPGKPQSSLDDDPSIFPAGEGFKELGVPPTIWLQVLEGPRRETATEWPWAEVGLGMSTMPRMGGIILS